MDYEQQISTTADLTRAWAALSAVTTYTDWTVSITSVTPLDGPHVAMGHRFRIKQPGFPPVVWRVTALREGESFEWKAQSPGVHTVAFHRISRNPDGTTRFTIGIHQTGVLSGLMAWLTATRTRRYLVLEANGLKAAAESPAQPHAQVDHKAQAQVETRSGHRAAPTEGG